MTRRITEPTNGSVVMRAEFVPDHGHQVILPVSKLNEVITLSSNI
jgi:hypothetical protein